MEDNENKIFDKYGNYNFPTEVHQDSPNTVLTEPVKQVSNEKEILIKIKKFFEPFSDSTTFSKRTIMAFLNEVAREFKIEVENE